jgi:hypothetical protein
LGWGSSFSIFIYYTPGSEIVQKTFRNGDSICVAKSIGPCKTPRENKNDKNGGKMKSVIFVVFAASSLLSVAHAAPVRFQMDCNVTAMTQMDTQQSYPMTPDSTGQNFTVNVNDTSIGVSLNAQVQSHYESFNGIDVLYYGANLLATQPTNVSMSTNGQFVPGSSDSVFSISNGLNDIGSSIFAMLSIECHPHL